MIYNRNPNHKSLFIPEAQTQIRTNQQNDMKVFNSVGTWLHKKIVDPLFQILRRGTEPNQLAVSAALGFTLGVFPICGVTFFLCGFAIALAGSLCHAPTLMLANFVATPIELRVAVGLMVLSAFMSLIIPFLRFGEFVTGGPHFPLTSDALKKVLTGQASSAVIQSIFNALLGWLIAAPFITVILYVIFLPCFKILVTKFSNGLVSPKQPLLAPLEVQLKVRDV